MRYFSNDDRDIIISATLNSSFGSSHSYTFEIRIVKGEDIHAMIYGNYNGYKTNIGGYEEGVEEGWKSVTAEEAQDYANKGYLVISSWINQGGHGHMQVVRPTQNYETYDEKNGPFVAQAGSKIYNYGTAKIPYGDKSFKSVKYYMHE